MKNAGERYRCSVCGNEVTVTRVGAETLVCCGKEMTSVSS
ncbi:MAG: desulforedoxin [Chloroflexi bacterium]|nr:MAG: desulforedoxin [Chloroflexota bacterium]